MNRGYRAGALRNGASVKILAAAMSAPLALVATNTFAGGLPTNGKYVAGSGAIQKSSGGMTIDQSSTTGIIDWKSFSIGQGKNVQFDNGSGATLNEVTGNNLSTIAGSLKGTGSVYLVNPSGVVVTSTGRVLTQGSFGATTGSATGNIVNAGSIASAHGDVTLGGNNVTNTGAVVSTQGGHIWLNASGSANLGGTISAANASGAGGSIVATGKTIDVSGQLNASGKTGGGTIAIGSWSANAANVAKGATLDASATQSGNGGHISVISNDTNFSGTASARGGAESGDGGTIETSGHTLEFAGAHVDASAAHGADGLWLLDPYSLTVNSSAATTIDNTLNGNTSVLLQTTAGGCSGAGTCVAGSGDINIMAALGWNTSATLTLDAYHSVNIDAPVTLTGAGGVTIKTDDGGSGGNYFFNGGNVAFTDVVSGNTQGSLTINGNSFTLADSVQQLATDIAANASGHYALANSYNAGPDGTYSASPIGTTFGGTFEGLGNIISNLSISAPSLNNIGLFTNSGGTIRDIGLAGGSVYGYQWVGMLAGRSTGTIFDSWSSGSVNGVLVAGGLVGLISSGSVTGSYATGSVTGGEFTGGLAGSSAGAISGSYATGGVNGGTYAGGLIGANGGSIANSYATGAVSGYEYVGGLVGGNGGPVSDAYATGAVTATYTYAGGFVGDNNTGGSISASYATGNVSGPTEVGGFAGSNENGASISYAFATGSATATAGGSPIVGGFVGEDYGGPEQGDMAPITQSYSTGAVHGGSGFVGFDETPGEITASYWDTQTSGTSTSGTSSGVAGLTTAQMRSASSFAGWNFGGLGSTWVIVDVDGSLNNASSAAGGTMPMLVSEYSTTIVNAQELQLMELAPAGNYTLAANLNLSAAGLGVLWGAQGFIPIGGGGGTANFTGSFSGNGYTLSNLFIDDTVGATPAGLFGTIGLGGSVSGVNLVNASVTVTNPTDAGALAGENLGTITQSDASGSIAGEVAGGLVGDNAGTIMQSYATDSVSGSLYSGGLAGYNAPASTIAQSYATGSVSTTGNASSVGGLVGDNEGSISLSFASGSVGGGAYGFAGGLVGMNGEEYAATISQSYATGAVGAPDGSAHLGGLIGENGGGTVSQSYATGAVTVTSDNYGGGLIGSNFNTSAGSITQSYALGAVSGAGTIGGFEGNDGSTTGTDIASSYWDTQTTGQSQGINSTHTFAGLTGKTTAQLQSALPAGFASAPWEILPGISFPYLQWQFSGTPQVISGSLANLANALAQVNGIALLPAISLDANGYYYLLLAPGTLGPSSNVVVYETGTNGGASFADAVSGSLTNFNILPNFLFETTPDAAYSTVVSDLNSAIGGNAALQTFVAGLSDLEIAPSAASFAINSAINDTLLVLSSTGAVTQSAAITAGSLDLLGAGGSYTLTDASNDVGTLAANTGTVSLNDGANSLSIGSANGTNGVTATTLTLTDTGSVTQSQAIAATNLELLGSGGDYTLTNGSNTIGTLAANTGTVSLSDGSNALSIGTAGGTSGVNVTTLTLNDTDAVTQTQAVAATNLELLGASGSYTLTGSGNNIGTLAANTGAVSLNDGANALSIGTAGGTSGVNVTTLTLNDTDAVTQSHAIVATNLELLGSGGSYTLTGSGNNIGTLAANTGTVSLNNGSDALTIGTAGGTSGVNVTTLTLNDTGTVMQSQAIAATNLELLGAGGAYTLSGSGNNIGTLAANTGAVSLNDGSNALAIGTAGATSGVTATTLTLNDTGTVTQSQAIAATNLELLGSGGTYTLTGSGNNIGTLAANTGAVSLNNGSNALALGAAGGTSGVNVTTLTLNDTAAVTQSHAIVATNLELLGSGGTYTLTGSGNNIGTLAANTGTVSLNDGSNALSIGTAGGTSGVTVTTLTLTDTGSVTQSQAVAATNLELLGTGGNYTLTDASNSIGTLAANTGSLALDDGTSLVVGTAGGTTGIAGSGAVTLKTMGTGSNLSIDAAISDAGQTVSMMSTGKIASNSAGIITAQRLSGSSSGTTTLTAANLIADLGPFTTGNRAFSLTDAHALTLTGALNAGTGNVTLTTTGSGDNLVVDAGLKGATVDLVSAGTIGQNSAGIITANTLTGSAASTTTLNAANRIASLGAFTNTGGSFTLTDDAALAIAGTLNAGAHAVTLVDTGTLSESTGAIDAVILRGSSAGGATLNGANLIGTLDAFTNTGAGGFALTDAKTLTVGGAVNTGTGNLTLTTTGTGDNLVVDAALTGGTLDLVSAGTLSQNSAGIINASTLTGSSAGATTLTAANDIADLGAFIDNTGAFSLTDAASLTVDGAVNAAAGALTLKTTGTGDNLSIDATLGAAAHPLTLISAGTIASNSSGILTAGTLTGSSVGATTLTAANVITDLGTFSTGNGAFSLTDSHGLTVIGAVNAGTGDLSLTTANLRSIAIDSSLTGDTVDLSSGGNVSENANGAVIANLLNVTANTGITLTSSLNDIESVGTNHTNSGPDIINPADSD